MLRWISTLPFWKKGLLAVVALIALALFIALSPLMVIMAIATLVVALFAIIYRALRGRPARNWGLIALVSLVLLMASTGMTAALYEGGQPERASSTLEPADEVKQQRPVEEAEEETGVDVVDPPQAEEQEASVEKVEENTTSKDEEVDPTEKEEQETSGEQAEDKAADGENKQREYDATVRVTRVVDGDTVKISPAVNGNDEVRLIGVDTPETKDPDCGVQPYGSQASAFSQSQLGGQEVGLEFDVERTDRYGRLLAYVHKNGDMFNETLLQEGYAQVATFSPKGTYVDCFRAAQEEARAAGRGLWGLSAEQLAQQTDRDNGIGGAGCTQKSQPKAPLKQQPQPTPEPTPDVDTPNTPTPGGGGSVSPLGNDCPPQAPIKGNQSSGIYHVPSGQFYARTNPEECFASEADASAAGYRKSKR